MSAASLIIKLGGAAVDTTTDLDHLYAVLAQLHREHPGGLVLVHGGGIAVDDHLERLGLVSQRHEGIRLTPPEHIDEIVGVLAGRVNKKLVGLLQRFDAPAVGICLGDGLTARTSKVEHESVDPGRVGEISGGDPHLITTLLGSGYLPVVCSIGLDDAGHPLNVNADDAAAGLASVLGAAGVVLLTDVAGVLDERGELIDELTTTRINTLIDSGAISGGMIVKVRGAQRAAEQAGTAVTIASWRDPDTLKQLARGQHVGTKVVPQQLVTQEGTLP